MEVFFSASTENILKHKDAYLNIVKTIKDNNHTLTREWLSKSIELAEKHVQDIKRTNIYTEVMSAIIQCDIAIFDCTVRSMSIGHQLTFALDKSKPTLLLAKVSDEKIEDLFISGSKSGFLTLRNYDDTSEIHGLVKDFINKHSSKPKVRFQLVMDKEQNDFIQWASFRYKRNKSDIIKSSIDKASSEDEDYQRYTNIQP